MRSRPQIVPAAPDDAEALSRVIALSFHLLAPSVWLIPDAEQRARIFPGYFRLLLDDAIARGHVDTTTDKTAAALWLPAGTASEPGPAGYDAELADITGAWAGRFRVFDALLARRHPNGPHHHLAILAVRPDRQHQGIGTALLNAGHRHLDRTDPPTAAYLEASDAMTRQLYLRHGYADLGQPILLPEGPAMYPMTRAVPANAGSTAGLEPSAQGIA